MTAARRSGLVLATLLPVLAVALQSSSGLPVGVMGPGETTLVSVIEDPDFYGEDAEDAEVSADGRHVVYQRRHDFGGSDSVEAAYYSDSDVWLRDRTTTTPLLLSGPTEDATSPTLSDDAQVAAYVVHGSDFGDTDVNAVDLSDPDLPRVRRVTDRATDVPLQRPVDCHDFGTDLSTGTCGPVLSGDGRSLALPSSLSVVSPQLRPRILFGSTPWLDPWQHGLALVDFQGENPEDTELQRRRVVQLTVTGRRAVRFGQALVQGDAFESYTPGEGALCNGARVTPGNSCVIGVAFTPDDAQCGTTYGLLRVDSPTPAGQTRFPLVGEHPGCAAPPPPPPGIAAACPAAPAPEARESGASDQFEDPTHHVIGENDVGRSEVAVQEVVNNGSGVVTIEFSASDCSMQLVVPEDDDGQACRAGDTLNDSDRCLAYVRFTPDTVAPALASLKLMTDGFVWRTFRFAGAGRDQVVVMRRDPAGTGNFAGPGSPPAQVVSVDASGATLRGEAPTLSRDGRYVGFVSGFPWDDPDPDAAHQRVLVHDTDAEADGTGVSGETLDVSRVPGEEGEQHADFAIQPSLSGDGRRIAFVEILREPEPTSGGTFWRAVGSRAHVRDLDLGRTLLASEVDPLSKEEIGFSRTPVLAGDGSTVAFTSNSRALVPGGVETDGQAQVYVRDLAPDFAATGTPRVDIVSLRADDTTNGVARQPALSEAGGVVVFTSSDRITDPTSEEYGNRVYARTRYGQPVVTPTALTFDEQEVGTIGPGKAVRVRNDGPGPFQVRTSVAGPFTVTRACPDTVHRGEECVLLVASAPDQVGDLRGTLMVRVSAPGFTGEVVRVSLSGTAIPALLRVEPASLIFGDQALGTTSAPRTVVVRNLGTAPLDLSATIGDTAEPVPDPTLGRAPVPESEVVPDFAVTVGSGGPAQCATVAPGTTCVFRVTFTPTGLGSRAGQLLVVAGAADQAPTRVISLAGTTAEPELTLSPTVAREGRVVFVTGLNFQPGLTLELTWTGGPVVLPTVVPDSSGRFTAPLVVLPGRRAGRHTLTLTMPGVGAISAPPVMIVAGSLQPPDFVNRN